MTVSGSIMIQNHLTSVILVGGLALLTAVVYWKRAAGGIGKKDKIWILASLAVALLLFSPCIIDGLKGKESNIYQLAHFFKHQPSFSHSLKESSIYILNFYLKPLSVIFHFQSFWWLLPFLLLAVIGPILEKGRAYKQIFLFTVVGFCLSIFAAMKVSGDLLEFLFWLEYVLAALFYTLAIFGLIQLGRLCLEYFKFPFFKKQKLLLVALAIFTLATMAALEKKYLNAALMDTRFINSMVDWLEPRSELTYKLDWKKGSQDHMQWYYATGLALKLKRMNCKVVVPDEWLFMFGEDFKDDVSQRSHEVVVYLFSPGHFRDQVKKSYSKTIFLQETILAMD